MNEKGQTYFLEKYMTKIYKRFLPDSNNSLNLTEDFIRKLKEIKLEKNLKILSFDLINLFPSIEKQNKSNNS